MACAHPLRRSPHGFDPILLENHIGRRSPAPIHKPFVLDAMRHRSPNAIRRQQYDCWNFALGRMSAADLD